MNDIALQKMTFDEARSCADEIRISIIDVGRKLLELYERDGWVALGYSTWRECAQIEFGFSQSYVYRLLGSAEVERNISPMGEKVQIPERQLRPLTVLKPEEQREVWQRATETAPNGKVTAAHVQNTVAEYLNATAEEQEPDEEYLDAEEEYLEDDEEDLEDGKENLEAIYTEDAFGHVETNRRPHVANNSGNNEWYTPSEYVEAARRVLGHIDLDPASSPEANETIQATRFYTTEDNGLIQDWCGNVYMNPPYSGDLIGNFTAKLADSVRSSAVPAAVVLVNNATETGWFQELIGIAAAVVFPKGRIRYLQPGGLPLATGLQGQAFIYIGKHPDAFLREFKQFGWGATLA